MPQDEMRALLRDVQRKSEQLEEQNAKLAKLYGQAHEFVDNVSHEFRTPLTVIKEYISLVCEGIAGEINEEQRRLLTVAEDRADDLNTMVDDMLDVSKLEAGMLGAWRKRCSVIDIIEDVREPLQRKACVKGTRLSWEMQDRSLEVYCDAEKAARVITNLVVNAIKFCGDGGNILVRVAAEDDSKDVCFFVEDDGPGIDEEELANIFARFKQLGQSVRASTKGFGLGLNIARELVDLNFGKIQVESEVGRGSKFFFTVPRYDPTEIMRRYVDRLRLRGRVVEAELSLMELTVPDGCDKRLLNDVDAFFNYCLRRDDLLFRVDESRWLVALPQCTADAEKYAERMEQERLSINRNRPFGPLPAPNVISRGMWKADRDVDRIIDTVASLFSPDENPKLLSV